MTCRDRCLRYLQRKQGTWVPSGHIQRLAAEKSTYTPSNVSRRLRELAQAGYIEVKQEKGHAHYRYVDDSIAKKCSAWDWDEI